MSCEQVTERLTDRIEAALSEPERRAVAVHLRRCPECSPRLAELRAVMGALRDLPPEPVAPDVRTDLLRLFRAWAAVG